jgi:ABC-type branched-subunit amino acid transport system substrate-binding protein
MGLNMSAEALERTCLGRDGRGVMRRLARLAVVTILASGLAASATGFATATPSVRGFDGTTVKVAGFGIKAQLPGSETGARARIKRFNDTNELKGIKIDYAEFADDKQDPAVAVSEARRLVTQEQIFAIVGDVSPYNPGVYFAQQQVPYFGWAFDTTYCSPKVSTQLWGFSWGGCIVAENPPWVGDLAKTAYEYLSKKAGKQHPTVMILGNDSDSGKRSIKVIATAYRGAGFDVVDTENKMPATAVSDYTPYAQAALTSNNGSAPDAINCIAATDCIPLYGLVHASGYSGLYISGLYSNLLVKAMEGSGVTSQFVNPTADTPGMKLLRKDLDAYQAGAGDKVDSGVIAGYSSTDMFIQALKTVAKKGKSNITPVNVQQAAARMTWRIDGLAGPTRYPQSTGFAYPVCMTLLISDGTQWNTTVPYECSTKKYPFKG